jgi:hypothetical protein
VECSSLIFVNGHVKFVCCHITNTSTSSTSGIKTYKIWLIHSTERCHHNTKCFLYWNDNNYGINYNDINVSMVDPKYRVIEKSRSTFLTCSIYQKLNYSGRNAVLSLDDHYKYTWERGEDHKVIAHMERQPSPSWFPSSLPLFQWHSWSSESTVHWNQKTKNNFILSVGNVHCH